MAARKKRPEVREAPAADAGRSVLTGRFKKHLRGLSTTREVADADDSVRIAPRRQPAAGPGLPANPRPGLLGSLGDDDDLDE